MSKCHWCGDDLGQLPLTPAAITVGDKEFCSENCLLKWMDYVDSLEQKPAKKLSAPSKPEAVKHFNWPALVVQLAIYGGLRYANHLDSSYLWWELFIDLPAIAIFLWIDSKYLR